METLPNFQRNFWKNLLKIVQKHQLILEKTCGGIAEKFW